MKFYFNEWINKIMPLMINRMIDKAEGEVYEGTAKAYFHEWDIRFELTPNRTLCDRIIKRGSD